MRIACLFTVAVLSSSAFSLSAATAETAVPATTVPDGAATAKVAIAEAAIAKAPPVELIETGPADIVEATVPQAPVELHEAAVPYGATVSGGADEGPILEAARSFGRDDGNAFGGHLMDTRDDVRLMRPITLAENMDATELQSERLANVELPEAEPLEASMAIPVALKAPPLKLAALTPTKPATAAEPLNEALAHEELTSRGIATLLEPKEITSTPISGRLINEPLTVIVSLKDQQLDVYRGLKRVETTRVSSGRPGHETLTGVFGILQKKKEHYSNLYDAAPMPWMQRLTRSGTALHAGVVPNRPASHGCVRMPNDFAPKLFRMTEIGGKVAMLTGPMVKPQPIESPTLVLPASSAELSELSIRESVVAGLREAAFAAARAPEKKKTAAAPDWGDVTAAPADERPWHILVTRREQRDIAIGAQQALAAMGYLPPQDKFVGYLGSGTKRAIRAFEKDHGLRPRGHFTEKVAAKIYEAAGKGPLPDAYLFLRRGFNRVRHVPVQLEDPKKPLGTHLFTYVHSSGEGDPGWVGMSLEGEDSKAVLDRITIPQDMRDEIALGLTSGASLIIADVGKHSSVLPEGDDFIVRTNDSAKSDAVAEKARAEQRKQAKKRRAAPPRKRVSRAKPQRRTVQRKTAKRNVSAPRGFRLFGRR